ncbi:MAG TPA: hypothetical protein PLC98_03650 [Anaerolineales bacterium]|nr:hypothetical protein [Anaerolineales bacterium]
MSEADDPITADRLLSAGWVQNNQQFQKYIGIFVYPFRDPVLVTIRNKHAKGVKTMGDLLDLERLICGAKRTA